MFCSEVLLRSTQWITEVKSTWCQHDKSRHISLLEVVSYSPISRWTWYTLSVSLSVCLSVCLSCAILSLIVLQCTYTAWHPWMLHQSVHSSAA